MLTADYFQAGLTILVDKPIGWTSFDVVAKIRGAIRRTYQLKKIKVGHSGTLDPFASGLLIIAIGRHTKRLDRFIQMNKAYRTGIRLGERSSTGDPEGEISETDSFEMPAKDAIEMVIASHFVGEIDQIPPVFSAKKVNGQRAYDLARKGQAVELKASRVRIDEFHIRDITDHIIIADVQCSKGTYIRSLASDLGDKLGCGAYCESLSRTAIGPYQLDSAIHLETLISWIESRNESAASVDVTKGIVTDFVE